MTTRTWAVEWGDAGGRGRYQCDLEEIERAGSLGTNLVVALNQKAGTMNDAPTFQELRSRAFTFLWKHYENCRRGVEFVRHFEGDAERIMPSLFTRRVKKTVVAPATEVVVQPV